MKTDPATDRACLEALRAGDDAALERLMDRWQRPLFAFAWRYVQNHADAEDLVAETFVRLHQQCGRLAPDTRLAAWLFTILANQCHNLHRWRRRHPTSSLEEAPTEAETPPPAALAAETPSPGDAAVRSETTAAVRAAVDRLPHDLKVAVLLHHYEHLSLREIGAVAGCSERGVETRLYRARQQLRTELTAHLREAVQA